MKKQRSLIPNNDALNLLENEFDFVGAVLLVRS